MNPTILDAILMQAHCPHTVFARMDQDDSRMCIACGVRWNPNVDATPNDVIMRLVATLEPHTTTNGEAILDLLGRAYEFDNKPHLVFNGLRQLAERYAPDDTRHICVSANGCATHKIIVRHTIGDLTKAHIKPT